VFRDELRVDCEMFRVFGERVVKDRSRMDCVLALIKVVSPGLLRRSSAFLFTSLWALRLDILFEISTRSGRC